MQKLHWLRALINTRQRKCKPRRLHVVANEIFVIWYDNDLKKKTFEFKIKSENVVDYEREMRKFFEVHRIPVGLMCRWYFVIFMLCFFCILYFVISFLYFVFCILLLYFSEVHQIPPGEMHRWWRRRCSAKKLGQWETSCQWWKWWKEMETTWRSWKWWKQKYCRSWVMVGNEMMVGSCVRACPIFLIL